MGCGVSWPVGTGQTEEKARSDFLEKLAHVGCRYHVSEVDGSVYVYNSYGERRYMVIDPLENYYRAWIPDVPSEGWRRRTGNVGVYCGAKFLKKI